MNGYRRYVMSLDGEYQEVLREDSRWVDPSRTKTKREAPYSYDEFFHFGSRRVLGAPGVHANYSDRLAGWDRAKFDRLWKEHMNTRWELASHEALTTFLSAYMGKPVEVVALAEGCNPSSGYPYYVIWHTE